MTHKVFDRLEGRNFGYNMDYSCEAVSLVSLKQMWISSGPEVSKVNKTKRRKRGRLFKTMWSTIERRSRSVTLRPPGSVCTYKVVRDMICQERLSSQPGDISPGLCTATQKLMYLGEKDTELQITRSDKKCQRLQDERGSAMMKGSV